MVSTGESFIGKELDPLNFLIPVVQTDRNLRAPHRMRSFAIPDQEERLERLNRQNSHSTDSFKRENKGPQMWLNVRTSALQVSICL